MTKPRKPGPCVDSRPCFARKEHRCAILEKGYSKDGQCLFCKPSREYTNGKFYPFNPLYGQERSVQ